MSSTVPTHRFGEFELDLAAFELRRHGQAVKLEKRAFDLLVLLVQRAGSVVPREELIAALWPPNVIVDFDSGLNTLVRKVRVALDDSPESPRYVETIAGRGYRFVAALGQAAHLQVRDPPVAPRRQETRPTPALPATPARPSARMAALATLLLLAVLGTLAAFVPQRPAPPARIAVLPFENLTGDAQLAYLASGLAEDTSIALARIDAANLRVVGVLGPAPDDATLPLSALGQRLGVDLLVKSSLRLERSRLRVTSRLLRVADGEQVWSASFDRELTNVRGLERALGAALGEQVRLVLSPEWQAAVARRQTRNPAAYSLYLKGRYEWAQLTPPSIRRGLQHFQQAAELDPDYALAWAAVAFASITSLRTMDAAPAAVRPVAQAALERAERLGADLAETRYARGYYHLFFEQDPAAAVKWARASIALDPDNAQAHLLLGVALAQLGQLVEARDMLRRSRELDPGFALAFANSASVALQAGDVGGAVELARQSIAINPDFWVGHLYLGQALQRRGDLPGALQALADAAELSEGHSLTYSARVPLLLELGRTAEARALVAEMAARADRQYVPAYAVAVNQALLGDVDAAFASLDRALAQGSIGLLGLPTDRRLAPLRGDPRFAALLERCGCAGRVGG